METPQERLAERERLNRRLSRLTKEQARELRRYRHAISRTHAVESRGKGMVLVKGKHGDFFEGADVVTLCHAFIDRLTTTT